MWREVCKVSYWAMTLLNVRYCSLMSAKINKNETKTSKQLLQTTSASKSQCTPSPDSGSAMVTSPQIPQICHQDPHPHGNPELPLGKGLVDKQARSCDQWKRLGILYLRRGTAKWMCDVSGKKRWTVFSQQLDGEREVQNGHKVSSLSTKTMKLQAKPLREPQTQMHGQTHPPLPLPRLLPHTNTTPTAPQHITHTHLDA